MTADRRLDWYRQLLEIRFFEEKVQELFMEGSIQGTTHLCQGQEAVSVGAVSALQDGDFLTVTYRGHGHALARGLPPEACFAELMGRSTGCCKGVGGSMHLTDISRGLLGSFAIVGAGLPIAVGAAMGAKLQGTGAVAMTFFGDGATNIGTFHEALNMASVWKAPIVFVVENNLYGEYTPLRESTPIDDLAERGAAYAMAAAHVDGQDVEAVHVATVEAVERARSGGGPTLLEMKTYRYRGHSRTDPARYRPEGELKHWQERDPITIFGRRLADEGLLSEEAQADLQGEVRQQLDEVAERAKSGPFSTLEEVRSYVYAA